MTASICLLAAGGLLVQAATDASNEILERARRLIEAHQLQQANELLSGWVSKNPDDASARVELGNVQLAQGLQEDAMKSFEQVLAIKPDSASAREGEVHAAIALALQDRGMGNDDGALISLIRAKQQVPDSPELLLDFGIQAERMRIFRDADDALTLAHKLAPNDLKILYALAHVQFDEQKMPEAEANLRAYLAARPDDATAHCGLGRLLQMLARDDEATAEFHKSIDLQPQQTESYYRLGEVALKLNESPAAKSQFEKVLSLAPHHGGALTGMGILAYRAKENAQAGGYLRSAVLYAPDYVTAHHYFALVLGRLGRQEEAQREREVATKLDQEQKKQSKGNFLTVIH